MISAPQAAFGRFVTDVTRYSLAGPLRAHQFGFLACGSNRLSVCSRSSGLGQAGDAPVAQLDRASDYGSEG